VVFSMARDGLLPKGLAAVGRYQVPSRATLVAGGAAIVLSQTVNVLTLEQLVVIGTLFAFLAVSAAVPALRRARPDLERPFRVPGGFTVPLLAIMAIAWLMLHLQVRTWSYFGLWMLAGLLLYLAYGRRHSRLREHLSKQPAPSPLSSPPPPGRSPFDVPPVDPRARARSYNHGQAGQPSTRGGTPPYAQGGPPPYPPSDGRPPVQDGPHYPQPYSQGEPRRPSPGAAPRYSRGGPGHYSQGTGQPSPQEAQQGYRPRGPRPYVQGGPRPYSEEWTPQSQPPSGGQPYPEGRPAPEDPDEHHHGGHHRR
jgi:basic amino acid/polyamine antiporter, APA family